jgi:hypothetical protein
LPAAAVRRGGSFCRIARSRRVCILSPLCHGSDLVQQIEAVPCKPDPDDGKSPAFTTGVIYHEKEAPLLSSFHQGFRAVVFLPRQGTTLALEEKAYRSYHPVSAGSQHAHNRCIVMATKCSMRSWLSPGCKACPG